MRKIIQISTAGVQNTNVTQCNHIVTVLCDDGTIWEMKDTVGGWVFVGDGTQMP